MTMNESEGKYSTFNGRDPHSSRKWHDMPSNRLECQNSPFRLLVRPTGIAGPQVENIWIPAESGASRFTSQATVVVTLSATRRTPWASTNVRQYMVKILLVPNSQLRLRLGPPVPVMRNEPRDYRPTSTTSEDFPSKWAPWVCRNRHIRTTAKNRKGQSVGALHNLQVANGHMSNTVDENDFDPRGQFICGRLNNTLRLSKTFSCRITALNSFQSSSIQFSDSFEWNS